MKTPETSFLKFSRCWLGSHTRSNSIFKPGFMIRFVDIFAN